MCPHDKFDILHYESYPEIIVRRCKGCGKVEIKINGYIDLKTLKKLLDEIDHM